MWSSILEIATPDGTVWIVMTIKKLAIYVYIASLKYNSFSSLYCLTNLIVFITLSKLTCPI